MPLSTSSTNWVVVPSPRPRASVRLFCFPFAGGGASAFTAWSRALSSEVEVCAIQMPGREERLREAPLTRWKEVTWRLSQALKPWMDRPFALFGHSLGGLVAFELARHLERDRQGELLHLFVSGREAPHLPLEEPPKHNLPHEKLLDELRQLAGTNEEVFKEPELLDIFIPLLRADFFLSESYVYEAGAPLDVPITAYGGMQDEHVLISKLEAWREQTSAAFRRLMFPGGHFFLHEHRAQILSDVTGELATALPSISRNSSYRRN